MTALHVVRGELLRLGYRDDAVLAGYVFADVLSEGDVDKRIDLAAFTQVPPSYRNAAIGVVSAHPSEAAEVVAGYRALGAPLFFVVSEQIVEIWQARSSGPAQRLTVVGLDSLPDLFAAERGNWNPEAIQRAKSIGPVEQSYQLDFVDAGLLPAIEGQIHAKLDRLLREVLATTQRRLSQQSAGTRDERFLFRTTFRLLAAKILADRGHEIAQQWDPQKLDTVLRVIGTHYKLPGPVAVPLSTVSAFLPAWDQLRAGMSFRNISADDLAFVYENTLVTADTRKHFGTHSTPRQVADYVVRQLELWRHDPGNLRVYEPFTGAGAFLVSAVRQFKDVLPPLWDPKRRHDFLVERVGGDELDAFAREVAMLSLILADYPNTNGWKIYEQNLFKNDVLAKRASEHNVVLCNPPFQSFTAAERQAYPEAASRSNSKALAALDAVLDSRPLALGFVLPEKFIMGQTGVEQRRRIESLYEAVEIVKLPDRVFEASVIRSCLVIARDLRSTASRGIVLRATEVSVADRERFLATGAVTERREQRRETSGEATGAIWVPRLVELWQYLQQTPRLGPLVTIRNGLQWWDEQNEHVSALRKRGYQPGIHRAGDLDQYSCRRVSWLDATREQHRRGADFDWQSPKLIATAAQLSRGPWCFAACYDSVGTLLCSQQLFAIWRKGGAQASYEELLAILNSPLTNAFMSEHSPKDRFRIATLESLPIPVHIAPELISAVRSYLTLKEEQRSVKGETLLKKIDALVLQSYDLPPRLERRLLEFFRDAPRPVPHAWSDWFDIEFAPTIPLNEYLSSRYGRLTSDALLRSLDGVWGEAVSTLNEYLD